MGLILYHGQPPLETASVCAMAGSCFTKTVREDRVDSSLHAMLEESYSHSLVDGKAFAFLGSGRAEEEMVIIS